MSSKLTIDFINQNINHRIKLLNYSLVNIEYNGSKTKLYLKCNNDNYEWTCSYKNFTISKSKCPCCSKRMPLDNQTVLKRITDKSKEKKIIFEDFKYNSSKSTFISVCNICNHKWNNTYVKLVLSDCGCPKCAGNLPLDNNDIKNKIFDKCKNLNYTVESISYCGSASKVILKCNNHDHIWETDYYTFINKDTKCFICSYTSKQSKPVSDIENYLIKNNINFIREYTFNSCKNKRLLPFDFYIEDLNLCIEYDGIQHFKPVEHWGGEEAFKHCVTNDNIKTQFCKNNNIILLRIRYDEDHLEKLNDFLKGGKQ